MLCDMIHEKVLEAGNFIFELIITFNIEKGFVSAFCKKRSRSDELGDIIFLIFEFKNLIRTFEKIKFKVRITIFENKMLFVKPF